MRRYASEPRAIVLLAYPGSQQEEDLLGFVLVNLFLRRNLRLAYITTLDVHPSHRRQGIAATLIRHAEVRSAAARASSLSLHVSTANPAAIHFYEQTGFTRRSFLRSFYGEGLDAHIYSKALA